MFIPLWALVCVVVLLAANFAIDLCRVLRSRRHHDHLLPTTPRSLRG